MRDITAAIRQSLASGTAMTLVSVIAQAGSTPRTAGACMLVFPDGSIRGTIGGGLVEAQALAAARGLLEGVPAGEAPEAAILHFSLEGATDMDMICGGSLSALLEPILPGSRAAADFSRAWDLEQAGKTHCRIARLPQNWQESAVRFVPARFLLVDQSSENDAAIPEEALRAARAAMAGERPPFVLECEGAAWLITPWTAPPRAFIFGAGHVSVPTAALAAQVGFAVTVVDDRPEFANETRFPQARAVVLPDLGEQAVAAFLDSVTPGPADALVIVTRGHAFDRDVLAAALATRAGYIGMIGSRSKRNAVYHSLRSRGVADAVLAAVRSPIGLPIMAETPEEIAVSIVAELIQWRRQGA